MSKNYEDYKPIYQGPPRMRRNPMLSFVQIAIIVLLMIALVVSGVYFVYLHAGSVDANPDIGMVPAPDTIPEETTESDLTDDTTGVDNNIIPEDEERIDLDSYTEIEVSKEQINKGNLIFVSSNYKIVYPGDDELVSMFSSKTSSYQISNATMKIHQDVVGALNAMMDDFVNETNLTDVIVWTSYRDEARQTTVYNEYVAKYGQEAAKTAVAKPGESDHHTGLGVALRVFRGGLSYQFSEVEGYSWFEEHCQEYGFVERYPDDKIEITGLDYSSSFYLRYVGDPHAEIMKKNNLCLEEYTILLKDYIFGKAHYEYTTEDGGEYEFYFVSGDVEGDVVSVPVPKEKVYTISGNNMDGFIVTVKK